MLSLVQKAFKDVDYQGSRVDPTLKPIGKAEDGDKHRTFRVDSILTDVEDVQQRLLDVLKDEQGDSLVKRYQVSYDMPAKTSALQRNPSIFYTSLQNDEPVATDPAAEQPADPKAADPDDAKDTKPADDSDETPKTATDDKPSSDSKTPDAPSPDAPTPEVKATDSEPTDQKATVPEAEKSVPPVTVTLRFGDSSVGVVQTAPDKPLAKIGQEAVAARVKQAIQELGLGNIPFEVDHLDWDRDPATQRSEWNVSLSTTPENADRILQRVQADINTQPVWPASKKIGGQIAGDFVKIAIVALILSLVGIVVYIWFRFQNVSWGFAAVIALVHDVLFMLAGIAVSYWLRDAPAFLQLTEFKIDLTVIAAFLTLIGYSINDTIVIFDRMREIKGKLPNVNRQIVNDSVNQTLSRSILTFLTTFITVVVLYAFGGPGIHGFAYAMLIGTFVGMYSTVFIAAPFLLWMLNRQPVKKPA